MVFDAVPGPATVVGLADRGERFRLVANVIDVVAPPEPLSNPPGCLCCPAAPAGPAHLRRAVAHGPAHHTALSAAVGSEEGIEGHCRRVRRA
ncbi:hypothetical protein [Streptosporangium subroseum]|uniref:hypothetical protein n=1 Tax=Streptosporangium subroseum TaxID=106412 RepID=UPI000B78B1DF